MNFSHIFDKCNPKTPPAAGGLAAFDTTVPAPEYTPVPPGVYVARVLRGELVTTRAGADAYRIFFELVEGPYAGKTVIRTWTFSEKALPYVRRDLALFGLTSSAQLLSPFPEPGREYRVKLWIVLQRDNHGHEFNDIKRVQLISAGPLTTPPAPPTAPPVPPTAPPAPTGPTAGPTTTGLTTAGLPPELARFALGKAEGGTDDR